MQQTGVVFDIQKFSVHDGPGIRTTVFVKGCPLRCLWCHNPESQSMRPEIFFTPEKCVGCGRCAAVCPEKCHHLTQSHLFDRAQCRRCGKCAGVCLPEALELAGRSVTVAETLAKVLEDKIFYETSGGGMTVSGGEPMMQFDFTLALVRAAKAEGLHVCLDTCGYADFAKYQEILPYIDLFLYDIKASDSVKHQAFTGVDHCRILDNLYRLDAAGARTVLRCPLIPGLNDDEDHLRNIGRIAERLLYVQEITVHPYHPLGQSKNVRLGVEQYYQNDRFATAEDCAGWLNIIASETTKPVRRN